MMKLKNVVIGAAEALKAYITEDSIKLYGHMSESRSVSCKLVYGALTVASFIRNI